MIIKTAELIAEDATKRIGTAIMLKVMPGDRFVLSADTWYDNYVESDNNVSMEDMVTSLMGALLGGQTYEGIPVSELPDNVRTVKQTLSNPALAGELSDVLHQDDNEKAPKAHLNYLFFDEGLKLVKTGSGSVQVPQGITDWTNITPAVTGTEVVGIEPGYVIIYVSNQSIGTSVWFDDIHVEHYNSELLDEHHYYPFGLTISNNAGSNITPNPYKYQGIELEQHFGLETYETFFRGLDPQLGRFNSIDPKAYAHYSASPYASMGNNPAINIDPRGDDWFVNSKNGDVVFVKNRSEVSQDLFDKIKFADKAADYERFGRDNMFGDVQQYGKSVLEHSFFPIENSEEFMNSQGYSQAEKAKIKETQVTSGGAMGMEETITLTTSKLKQIGESKITYAKSKNLNKKDNLIDKTTPGSFSSIRTVKYDLIKPRRQDNAATAEIYENKKNSVSNQQATFVEKVVEFISDTFIKKK